MTGAIYVAGPLDYENRKRVSQFVFEHSGNKCNNISIIHNVGFLRNIWN